MSNVKRIVYPISIEVPIFKIDFPHMKLNTNLMPLFLLVLLLGSCKTEEKKQGNEKDFALTSNTITSIKFNCADLGEDEMGIPRSILYLTVNGKTIEIAKIQNCLPIDKEQYASHNMDENAADASYGYWAGKGAYFYVILKENEGYIYRAKVDEMDDQPMSYSLFGIYSNGKFFEKDQDPKNTQASKDLLPVTFPSIDKNSSSKEIEDIIQPNVNQINKALPFLKVISKEVQFKFDDFKTPITIWYSDENLPVKMKMGIRDDEGLFSNDFEYYFINGKIWYSDQILSKYVFENEALQHYINSVWTNIQVSEKRFKAWEKRILQTIAQIDNATINSRNDDDKAITGNYELIQGKWQSTDDSKSQIAFIGSIKEDFYNGEPISQTPFSISSTCKNETNISAEVAPDAFMTLPEEDQCFFILRLDENLLQLNYVGRGNTLTYKRLR